MSFLHIPLAGWAEISVLLVLLTLLVRPVGHYVADVLMGRNVFLTPFVRPLEKIIYALCRIDPAAQMGARDYLSALLVFSGLSFTALFLFLLLQPFPQISPALAFNIAVSFITNTNWQSYAPESTLTQMRQMAGLAVENFLSAAVGLSVMAALARAIGFSKAEGIGNFWADMTRSVLYILLPMALCFAVFLVSQGVVQSFESSAAYFALETGQAGLLPLGPVASQVAIKQIGTNGGGYFMANAAHPFENPTGLTNILQIIAILLLPAALTISYDRLTTCKPHGWALYWTMLFLFLPPLIACISFEHLGNPLFSQMGIDQTIGNMEGKELRFGVTSSAFWAAATTATSSGSLNMSLDSALPLAGLVPLAFMQFGEVVFGGIGSGLYGMLVYVLLTAFLAGLMVGRTPEYNGKKIGVYEMKLVCLIIIMHAFLTLTGTALATLVDPAMHESLNPSYRGFTEILYAFSSASFNNGSALAGIHANTSFMNLALGLCMIGGRFGVISAVLLICSAMAPKTIAPASAGTFKTDTPLFVGLLIGVIVVISILTFVPSWALGPMAEHFHLSALAGGVK